MPIRRRLQQFGGSHAQRDALHRTLLEAALRSGEHDLARALTAERIAARDASNYNWRQRARVLRTSGDVSSAAAADARADGNRDRFAGALRD